MTEPKFVGQWRADLLAGITGVQLAEVDHPLEIYVGASDTGQARLQIRSTIKPKQPTLSDLVLIDRTIHGDMWMLTLTLQDKRFNEVFIRLAGHIAERSRDEASEKAAWLAIDSVLDEWRRLMRQRPLGVLSLDELRGLIGELFVVLELVGKEVGIEAAVAGWLGPLGSPQDFWFDSSGFHEVKAIGPTATKIRLSSAEQLDATPLELLVLVAPQVPETTPGAENLPGMVTRVKAALDEAAASHAEFDDRLVRLGVNPEDPYYSDIWFVVTRIEKFEVSTDFPAIRASAIAPGIGAVKYQVDRSAIVPFMTDSISID